MAITPAKSHSELRALFRLVSPEVYVDERNKSNRNMFLMPYTPEQLRKMDAKTYLTDDGTGIALTRNNDMIGVFNNSGRRGAAVEAVIFGIAEGAKTLDCIDGFLVGYYKRFGFIIKKREKWDDKLAPDGWEYSTYGRPDIVFFEYPDDLEREPSDVARRYELARNR